MLSATSGGQRQKRVWTGNSAENGESFPVSKRFKRLSLDNSKSVGCALRTNENPAFSQGSEIDQSGASSGNLGRQTGDAGHSGEAFQDCSPLHSHESSSSNNNSDQTPNAKTPEESSVHVTPETASSENPDSGVKELGAEAEKDAVKNGAKGTRNAGRRKRAGTRAKKSGGAGNEAESTGNDLIETTGSASQSSTLEDFEVTSSGDRKRNLRMRKSKTSKQDFPGTNEETEIAPRRSQRARKH